ncbi:class II aldolase/adducin family protein [Dictyobacter aurantiacus]|uniref:L-ribulose-5-phosphate 4-epimerase n=1 Tax=Dictyobacter aurantiacus TaxID=1936993 RepID=A0A401ZHR7_9CHLR|nr:class II aldolase/adducin family protein [Dictyobacter aurantiacus]GCE06248.1 L-ribulose-5-phosphate 4-epimerase [Dictyobacter aurantiacus]
MLLNDLRTQVAHYARKMYESQLVRATQGNLSARDRESGLICITPSGADYQTLTAEDIAVVDEKGNIIEGKWKPSVETPLHTHILRLRRDINCVMHTHALYTSAFGVVYQPLPMILQESAACLGGEVPIVPYQESGTQAFAELVGQTLGDRSAVIWGNHGAMVVGINLALTFSIAHALEDTARVYSLARQLGTPVPLPPEEVARLHAHWKEGYGQTAIGTH